MLVTIIADASYCPETGAAGYGFWVVCGRGRRVGSGSMKKPVINNNAAEMMALVNALHQAHAWGLVCQGDRVLLQTDCDAAIRGFQGLRKSITADEEQVASFFTHLCATFDITTTFRHVKGHTRGKTPRTWVNNRCDALAGDAMRVVRAQIRRERSAALAATALETELTP